MYPPPASCRVLYFFFFNDTATTEIYTLSLHDALPIYARIARHVRGAISNILGGRGPRRDRVLSALFQIDGAGRRRTLPRRRGGSAAAPCGKSYLAPPCRSVCEVFKTYLVRGGDPDPVESAISRPEDSSL